MRRLSVLVALSVLGCTGQGGSPVQETEQVAGLMLAGLRGCSAGLTPEGSIDQGGLAASGWRVVSRMTQFETQDRQLAAGDYPRLRPDEYEFTEWTRDGLPNRMSLTRWDGRPEAMRDECLVDGRVLNRAEAERVVAAMTGYFGRRPDRAGERPRGGDFLTPRFDQVWTAHYWAMPRNDAYLSINDHGYVRLEVLAMANRAALDEYSSDRPEIRIPFPEGPP